MAVGEDFTSELDSIGESLVAMTRLVRSAVAGASSALLTADLRTAESVIAADLTVDLLYREIEGRAFDLLAAHRPSREDLGTLVASLRNVADLERMGDLALHVAKVARRRYPASAVPPELNPTLRHMGQAAEAIVAKVADVLVERDPVLAVELERDDDVMDALHRELFLALLDEHWTHGVEAAIDITLCGRYYERFADHAVSVARRVAALAAPSGPR